MAGVDYKKLKFKAGLEIHQQLDSSKLFCRCPSVLRQDEPDFEVSRRLHAVAGEAGRVDVAAQHEAQKSQEFVYQGYDTTCLVELDEEPPHEINKEALNIAIQIALLMKMKIVPVTQIMRKVVVDGSNTSGFQRTVLIARDGFVSTASGKVGIQYLYLEEDAARIVSRDDKRVIYKLDRLGIPLVEIVTAPDVKTPEQAKEVALKIGETLRSCKVRRGIGTIRQDVNVSIRNENRVEIKGMQNMDIFIDVIKSEVERQRELSEAGKPTAMEVRNAQKDGTTEFMRPLPGSARMYPETDLPILKISRNFINDVKKSLPRLRRDVERELKEKGLSLEMVGVLFKEGKLEEFRELATVVDDPNLIAKVLLVYPKEIAAHRKRALEDVRKILNSDVLIFVLERFKEGKISESQIREVLDKVAGGVDVMDAVSFEKVDTSLIEELILKIIKSKPGLSEKAYMGLVMKEFRGKIDGKIAMGIIRKLLKQ